MAEPSRDTAEDERQRTTTAQSPFTRVRRRRLPRLHPAILVAVFVGGIAGGLARYAITESWSAPKHGFPWAVFSINTTGAFALSLLVVLIADVLAPRPLLRPVLGTGFLGAFTTFSSVVTTTDQLLASGHSATAVGYLGGSTLAALVAATLGLLAGRAIVAARPGSNRR